MSTQPPEDGILVGQPNPTFHHLIGHGVVLVAFAAAVYTLMPSSRALALRNSVGVPSTLPALSPGDKVRLPPTDRFGRSLPKGRKLLIVLADCESCAAKRIDIDALGETRYRSPVVLVLTSPPPPRGIGRSEDLYVVEWPNPVIDPALALTAPHVAAIDGDGVVLEVANPPGEEAFLLREAKR